MIRTLLLVLLLVVAVPAAAAPGELDLPSPYLIDNNTIPKIVCVNGTIGTGVYLGNGLIATARHVVANTHCTVSGLPVKIVPGSVAAGDFALLEVNGRAQVRALIDCGGIKEGELYLATGYAEDANATVTQMLTGTSARVHTKPFDGLAVFRGSITQGMSGGPIVKLSNGALVGLISANAIYGVTQVLGLSLSDTSLCRKG